MHVSVIVPFYNSERFIGRCIEGLLGQNFPLEHYEIFMIDNNSTDASTKIVRQYPRIQLLFEAKQGAYAARNRGLREAKGEIMAFTDADCVPSRDWLKEIVAGLEHPDIEIVLGHRTFAGTSLLLPMLAAYDHEKHSYVFNSEIKELYYGHTNNMGIGKKLLDEIGPFVERARGADTIFIRQAVNRYSCEVVRYCPRMLVRHMEIDSLYKLYRKYFIYGRSSRRYGRIVNVISLPNRARMQVFLKVIQSEGYSLMESTLLFGLLGMGLVSWGLGNISIPWRWKGTPD